MQIHQTTLFDFFAAGDKVTVRVPENWPDGHAARAHGCMGVIEANPANAPGTYLVRVNISATEAPLWSLPESWLRLVGVSP